MSAPRTLTLLADELSVCRLSAEASLPTWALKGRFFCVVKTDDELSVVCAGSAVPNGIRHEPAWRCLKVAGPIDFALTGVLSGILQPLADVKVGIFAVSTFDTDYILVKEAALAVAIAALSAAGFKIVTA